MLEVRSLAKQYGNAAKATQAIGDVTLAVGNAEFVCVVGPSGCGKTTLLKCISGLVSPTSGSVLLHEREVKSPPAEMALVFQDYSRSLLPWMSVKANILLPLRRKRLPKREQHQTVEEALNAVGLTKFMDHYPWQLSGGMQQRAAIARALAYKPEILLMDEPFASVDAQTRAELEDLLLNVWGTFGITVLFVTHDIDEAVYLGDRVIVLSRPPSKVDVVISDLLPRPRDQIETKRLPEFAALRSEIYSRIRGTSSSSQPSMISRESRAVAMMTR